MKLKPVLTIYLFTCFLFNVQQSYAQERLSDGVLFEIKKQKETDAQWIKIQVLTEDIIHVIGSPQKTFSSHRSLMVEKTNWEPVDWYMHENDNYVEISTSKIKVRVDKNNGAITYLDSEGEVILQEKTDGGKIITPAEVMGEKTYHIQQLFNLPAGQAGSPEDEAFYGLGQHQNDLMNYKGHDVDLWQLNIVAAIPFLVSSKNYGILWDNNSRTKFGDIRDYQSLSSLKLFDKNGNEGGLTAGYFNDGNFNSFFSSRTENRIEHEFLDVNDEYPEGFNLNGGSVRWSGEIECNEPGIHKFRLYSSNYTKMWLNGELVVDSWRQNWLPWTHLPTLNMEKGKRYSIKIEWIPNGGYIGLKYLTPEDEKYKNSLSLYSEVADQIDYYFIYGENIDEIVQGYREITGKATMMPKWAMGLWQCRERYRTQEELLSVVKEFRRRQIPLDNIVQDWFYWEEDKWGDHEFDLTRFPDAQGMVKELHEKLNTHIMISVWPKFYVGTKNYKLFNEKGWLYKKNVEVGQKDWVGPGYVSTFYDPYDEGARELYWSLINKKLFSLGFDAWWLDSTEPDIQSNLSREELIRRIGPTALGSASRYLNTYSLMNTKGVYDGQRLTNPDQRVFILTRSAFAGQQRYAAATWSGDIAARWYDLKAQIPAGLNFSISGIPYWTTDIGGFAVEPRYENPNEADLEEWRELNTRWFQFGTFCPLFRVHGQFPYREMFNIAPDGHPAYQTMLAYDKLRYRLMPYIYSLTGMVTQNDYTIMRALVMDFGNDKNVLSIGDQFMFGPALLVNPVTEYKARSRNVYLPDGSGWYDLKSGKYFEGGQTITADAPYSDIPIFVKEGSIISCGPDIQYTDEKPADPIRLFVYTGSDGSFTLYEDENVNYNYEKGIFSLIPFSYNEKEKTLTIEKRQGKFPGMLETRTFEIVWITKEKQSSLGFISKPDVVITYIGSQQIIKME
ncbi:MAG: alpha-xylosidase [Ignavibacteria bacterium GWA2_35_9]|nr:MAG: alpha-xylosidase [Ignavibacteria bacterium GWA2_35_9]OGU49763.1 MAG: alpha-xylosidase [Ignavibacteria bacterium GWC2_36_12]